MLNIDWEYIHKNEGGQFLHGYVPTESSGVTIACGFDVGTREAREIEAIDDFSDELKAKLTPYCNKRGAEAKAALADTPLNVTKEEADSIDDHLQRNYMKPLVKNFNAAKVDKVPAFEDLPRAVQTIIADVAYPYGVNLHRACPSFWRCITTGDWWGMLDELDDFGGPIASRQKRGADYIRAKLNANR